MIIAEQIGELLVAIGELVASASGFAGIIMAGVYLFADESFKYEATAFRLAVIFFLVAIWLKS